MTKNILSLILILFGIGSLTSKTFAQAKDSRGYYLVESEKFTPPEKEVIASFQDKKAENFLAADLKGVERTLNDYKGKPTLLVFGELGNEKLINALKSTYTNNKGGFYIVFMAAESRNNLLQNGVSADNFPFTIIPEGSIFGEMAYAGSLGLPRIFGIDSEGIIKRIIPSSIVSEYTILAEVIEETYTLLNQ